MADNFLQYTRLSEIERGVGLSEEDIIAVNRVVGGRQVTFRISVAALADLIERELQAE